jgi:hypothetical protein
MKLNKDEIEFIKRFKEPLESIFVKRKEDFINALLIEKDPVKSEALKMVVREWDNWLLIKRNIVNLKERKKSDKDFTGV